MRFPLFISAIVGLGLVAPHALAADATRLKPSPSRVEVPMVEDDFSSGWYARVDLGGAMRMWPSVSYAPTGGAPNALSDARFDNAYFGGIGAGFKYQSLRLDVTADWRLNATLAASDAVQIHSFAVGGQTLMLNGYYDLGAFSGFTPYIGAGLGFARQTVGNHQVQPLGSGPVTAGTALSNTTQYKFAWSLMAGAAFDITPQVKLDMGYRYMNTGSMTVGDISGGRYTFSAPSAHEFRIGLRYMFADGLPSRLLGNR